MGFSEGSKMGLPTLVMLRTMPFMMPEMLGITIPVAMLYAVSSVFGRMTGANEIVAIKSLGINPMVVVWPVVVLAGFLSLGTVWMYEIAATWFAAKRPTDRLRIDRGDRSTGCCKRIIRSKGKTSRSRSL